MILTVIPTSAANPTAAASASSSVGIFAGAGIGAAILIAIAVVVIYRHLKSVPVNNTLGSGGVKLLSNGLYSNLGPQSKRCVIFNEGYLSTSALVPHDSTYAETACSTQYEVLLSNTDGYLETEPQSEDIPNLYSDLPIVSCKTDDNSSYTFLSADASSYTFLSADAGGMGKTINSGKPQIVYVSSTDDDSHYGVVESNMIENDFFGFLSTPHYSEVVARNARPT